MSLVKARAALISVGLAGAATVAGLMPLPVEASVAALRGVNVQALAVSPAYSHDGVILAVGSVGGGCKSNCYHMWVSHDRGASWHRAAGTGWSGGNPVVALDGTGKEIIFTGNSTGVQRSDDLGATWTTVGAVGNPAVSPSFASDHLVAVAGKSDYTIQGTTTQNVSGSGGTMSDGYWSIMAGFPSTGSVTPLFLGGVTSAGKAAVEHCNASFSCSTPTVLPVPDAFAGAPLILPSTAYAQDRTVFAHTAEGIFKSTDGGTSFLPVTPNVPGAVHVATTQTALSPYYRENGPDRRVWSALLAIKGTGKDMQPTGDLYSSTDGGATWTGVGTPGPFDQGSTSVAVAPDGRIVAGLSQFAGGGLLCSVDGKVWQGYCPAAGAQTSGGGGQHTGSACQGSGCQNGVAAATSQPTGSAAATAQASSEPGVGPVTAAPGQGSTSSKIPVAPLLGGLVVIVAGAGGLRFLLHRRRMPRN